MRHPLCPSCRHRLDRHGPKGCTASYSAGPSGTFRCTCEQKPPDCPLRPLTTEEAEAAYEAASPAPLPKERIDEIVRIATKPKRARRLAAIVNWINANLPDLFAEITEGYCNTDRQIGRLRHPGKGRHGNRLIVRVRSARKLFSEWPRLLDHNSAQTYRNNGEVEQWLEQLLKERAKKKGGKK